MSLSGRQHGFYKHLFEAVLKVRPDADRVAMHRELGLPESRADWSNRHFDEWVRACRAITEPANLDAQIHGLNGEIVRRVWRVHRYLARLGKGDGYALAIAAKNGAHPGVPLTALDEECLAAVIAGLKRDVRSAGNDAPSARPPPRTPRRCIPT